MSDRSGDCAKMLEHMSFGADKTLKFSGHIILGADHGCDKVFRDIEQKIGVHKLMSISAGERVFSSPSSIHTLAQIAIAKLLSPSHAVHSVSLYSEYVN